MDPFLKMGEATGVTIKRMAFGPFLTFAKQQREMTKFREDYETWTTQAKFSHIYLELNAVAANVAVARFWSHWRTEQI